jgi:hypothetical protein
MVETVELDAPHSPMTSDHRRPSHLRNITADRVASAAAPTKIAALVSVSVSGSSGEPGHQRPA